MSRLGITLVLGVMGYSCGNEDVDSGADASPQIDFCLPKTRIGENH